MDAATGMRVTAPNGVAIDGDLVHPDGAVGVVVFAHGSGSSRLSPRNRMVASQLNQVGMATLLLDLLTPDEEDVDAVTRELRFDIELLSARLAAAADHVAALTDLPVGYFGASTGAAAALVAAAEHPERIRAIVSRGGRPDLAGARLADVRAPTLLICGGNDPVVIDLNRQAQQRLAQTRADLEVIPRATHLFEEPGALDEVARLAADWFVTHLTERGNR
jgi:putative phosphoribosyl transferase